MNLGDTVWSMKEEFLSCESEESLYVARMYDMWGTVRQSR